MSLFSRTIMSEKRRLAIETFRERINNSEFRNLSFESFADECVAQTTIHEDKDEIVIRLATQYADAANDPESLGNVNRTSHTWEHAFFGYILDFEDILNA